MRYSLRTLLIVILLTAPLSLWAWPKYVAWREAREKARATLLTQQPYFISRVGPLKEKPEALLERYKTDEAQDVPE